MPRFGLGVWQCTANTAFNAVTSALELGYRLIDTAMIYGNEASVGAAIRAANIPREKVFVATKLWNLDHGYDEALRAFDGSLARLDIGYIDLYLSHFPVPERRVPAWKAMQTLLKGGRCRAIGVSNYTVRHLRELIDATGIVPSVNQVEFHPFLFQKDLLEYCRTQGIQLMAYSPLTHGKKLGDQRLVAMSERSDHTAAQILLRWGLEHDLVVVAKSSRPERLAENAEALDFQLSPTDKRMLDSWNENLRTCWDPSDEL